MVIFLHETHLHSDLYHLHDHLKGTILTLSFCDYKCFCFCYKEPFAKSCWKELFAKSIQVVKFV